VTPVPGTPEKIIRNLWNIFSTFFSMQDIEKEISGEVKVALCGDSPRVMELYELMQKREKDAEGEEKKVETPEMLRLCPFPPTEEDLAFLGKCHIAVFIMTDRTLNADRLRDMNRKIPYDEKRFLWYVDGEADEMRREEVADCFEEIGVEELHWVKDEWELLPRKVLEMVKEKGLSFAEKFAPLRDEMTRRLISKTASENANVAFVSALPTNLPIVGIIIGLIAVAGETLFMTANQLRMCLRIAGIYGFKVDFTSRMGELWPVLAGGYGWRTLARGLAGFIPSGGPFLKMAIACAGTWSIGQAAHWFYRDGKKITAEELKDLYNRKKVQVLDNLQKLLPRGGKQQEPDDDDLPSCSGPKV
jgi:uncharacterized protein (DUF697 family)